MIKYITAIFPTLGDILEVVRCYTKLCGFARRPNRAAENVNTVLMMDAVQETEHAMFSRLHIVLQSLLLKQTFRGLSKPN